MSLNNEDIKQLIAILQKGLTTNETEHDDASENPDKEIDTIIDKKTNTDTLADVPVLGKKKTINKFLNMQEKNMHKDDISVDKILSKHPPVSRSREFIPVKVKCRVCGKEETINPGLSYDSRENRYKCNRCSTSSG
jgi:predicted transcriptional regulator